MTDAARGGGAAPGTVRVWDPLVRLIHWGLVATFGVSWLTAEEWQPVHEFTGYTVAGLVALRLVWGLVGGRYARFAQFVQGPGPTPAYLGRLLRGTERRYLGHNPAGGAMIVALLVTLSATALTGWLMAEPARVVLLPDPAGLVAPAWAGNDDDDRGETGELLEDLHETLANLLLALVALHVAGVVLASVRHRENLARAMVTGDKRAPGPGDIA